MCFSPHARRCPPPAAAAKEELSAPWRQHHRNRPPVLHDIHTSQDGDVVGHRNYSSRHWRILVSTFGYFSQHNDGVNAVAAAAAGRAAELPVRTATQGSIFTTIASGLGGGYPPLAQGPPPCEPPLIRIFGA
jgi:hypothetical protein